MRDHDCEVCRKKKLFKDRVCYRFDEFRPTPEGAILRVPLVDATGAVLTDEKTRQPLYEMRELSEEGFLEVLWSFQRVLPEFSAYQIAVMLFKTVCIEAFADPIAQRITEAETEVSEYGIDINNEDIRTELLGFFMTLPDLIEGFARVRGTKFAYDRYKFEEATKDQ